MRKHAIFFFYFLFSAALLHAAVEDHFKQAVDKSGFHQMKNIDFIYMINLDERPEKFESCTKQLHPLGIYPYRFSAVNGWKLTLNDINGVGVIYEPWMLSGTWGTWYQLDGDGKANHEIVQVVGKTYFCHCMSQGAIGIALSHLSILQDAYDSGYETIWVMEDDIEVVQNPHILSVLIDQLDEFVGKEEWDILFTDPDTKNSLGQYVPCNAYAWRPNFIPSDRNRFAQRQEIIPDLRRIGARYGAYSMIIRRSGIQKILNFFKCHQIFLPYDMEYTLPNDIHLFTVTRDVVSTQPKASSDNGAPNYLKNEQ